MVIVGNPAKRSPLLVALFTFLTLGLYGIVWWFLTNRDLRDLGTRIGAEELEVDPWKSALAISIGLPLIVPAVISLVRTCRRVEFAERRLEVPIEGPTQNPFSVAAASMLTVFVPAAGFAYVQVVLNRIWEAESSPGKQPTPLAVASAG